jgi:hypothetical protein
MKCEMFVKENTWSRGYVECGWGNGYVILPKDHKLWGIDYMDIDIEVHGGLTFGCNRDKLDWPEIPQNCENGWILGFDTAHLGDNLTKWPKSAVIVETEKLKKLLENY